MQIPDNSIDLILTDPPYNLANFCKDRQSNIHTMRPNHFTQSSWDEFDNKSFDVLMSDFLSQAQRVLRRGGGAIIFTSVLRINDLITLAKNTSLYYKTTGIWHKTNPMPRNMKYHFVSSIDPWLYFVNDKRTGTFNNNGKAIHDHIECAVASKRERTQGTHPTQKPESSHSIHNSLI